MCDCDFSYIYACEGEPRIHSRLRSKFRNLLVFVSVFLLRQYVEKKQVNAGGAVCLVTPFYFLLSNAFSVCVCVCVCVCTATAEPLHWGNPQHSVLLSDTPVYTRSHTRTHTYTHVHTHTPHALPGLEAPPSTPVPEL